MSAPSWPPAWADCWSRVGLPVPPRLRVEVPEAKEEPKLGEWAPAGARRRAMSEEVLDA